jgi:hypothetical protein
VQPKVEAPIIAALSDLWASFESVDHPPLSIVDGLFGFLQIGDGLVDVRTIRLDQTSTSRDN